MNDVSTNSTLAISPGTAESREQLRNLIDATVHWLALGAAVLVTALTASEDRWDLARLGIIAAFAVISELASMLIPAGTFYLSGSLLGITLAAVLGGPGPAAAVGVLVLVVGWFNSREAFHKFRHNLVNFVWYALLAGLFFHAASTTMHAGKDDMVYYLLVFGTFVVALAVNFVLAATYVSFLTRTSFLGKVPDLRPMMVAETSSAILTMVAVYLTMHLPANSGLILFALVLVVFQYLMGELLISERRRRELQLLATTDELTGLANRKHFSDLIEKAIGETRGYGGSFGVMLLDLDRFKDINDSLGHEYGDDLLEQVGKTLKERLGEGTVVARFGGDEFAILPEQRTADIAELAGIADRVLAAVQEPIAIGVVTLAIDASVGAVRYPADGGDVQTLLRRAVIAMYAAKEHHDGYRLYSPEHERNSTTQLSLLADFRRALDNDELVLFYHPIIDLHEQRVSGAEALVRWQHPERGLLPPSAFVGLVEQTGLIGKLTETVLDKALTECARWRAAGQELSVGVNLSVRNLLDPGLPNMIKRKLASHGLPPESLKLEITESMIMSDPDRAVRTVRALGELGVKIAVDDFGTGHSSLANLRRLPIDELKIDRSFVTPMLNDESDMVIVRSTIDLAHALGLQVIAEGVENADTLRMLESLGCDRAQGHFMSTPMPARSFPEWSRTFEDDYRSAA